MKKLTPQEYQNKITKKVPQSKIGINSLKAFLIGGTISALGQAILNFYTMINLSKDHAASLTSVTLIFLSVLLTGLDVYRKIAKHGGAGTLVPITGFANAMSSPAIESKTEGLILGVGAKLFTIAGPVIAYGIVASFIAGILIFVFNI